MRARRRGERRHVLAVDDLEAEDGLHQGAFAQADAVGVVALAVLQLADAADRAAGHQELARWR
jgi:hypothetical protein